MNANSVEGENSDSAGANDRAVHKGLKEITQEIGELKQAMKNDLTAFRDDFNTNFRQEFASFKEDVTSKLMANNNQLQDHKRSIDEAEKRTVKLETWNIQAKEVLVKTIQQQRKLQEKLTNMEGRSRRSSIRIFRVPEGAEGDSVPRFIENLLWSELALPEGTDLSIQRAHRAAARKPDPGETPRSIIVNFLQFHTKEMLLKKAWLKQIKLDGKPLFFDHDDTAEVVQKRKAYAEIKKALKEKNIKSQTPLTSSTHSIKEKWGKESELQLSTEDWHHICHIQQTATSSRIWKEFCWKNIIRFFITPKTKSDF